MAEAKKRAPKKKKETPVDLVSLNKMASDGYNALKPVKGDRVRHAVNRLKARASK